MRPPDHTETAEADVKHDLLVRIGRKHYTRESFITECRTQGACRRVHQLPKDVEPGITRVFVLEPGTPGREGQMNHIFGFFVIQRVELIVRDEDAAQELAKAQKKWQICGDLTAVRVSEAGFEPPRECGHRDQPGSIYMVTAPDYDETFDEMALDVNTVADLQGPLFVFRQPVEWPGTPGRSYSRVNGDDIIRLAGGLAPLVTKTDEIGFAYNRAERSMRVERPTP